MSRVRAPASLGAGSLASSWKLSSVTEPGGTSAAEGLFRAAAPIAALPRSVQTLPSPRVADLGARRPLAQQLRSRRSLLGSLDDRSFL